MTEDPCVDGDSFVDTDSDVDLDAERGRMQRSALSGSVWTMVNSLISLPLNIVVNVVVARLLGPSQYGILAAATAIIGITTALSNLGSADATVQWGTALDVRGRRADFLELIRKCSGYYLLVQVPVLVVLALVVLRDVDAPIAVMGAVGIGLSTSLGAAAVAQVAMSQTARAAQIAMVTNITTQLSVLAAAALTHLGHGVWAARLLAGAVPMVVIFVALQPSVRAAVLRPRLPRRLPSGLRRFALTAWVGAAVSTALFSRSEVFILQYYGLTEAAGVFALAFGLSYQLTAGVDALINPLVPAAAGLFALDREAVTAGLAKALRLVCAATSVVLAVLMPVVVVLIPIVYSKTFGETSQLFVPLAVVSCLQSVNAVVLTFVIAARRVGSVVVVNVLALALDLGLAIVLVPHFEAWGATVANASAQLLAIVGSWKVLTTAIPLALRDVVAPLVQLARGSLVGSLLSYAVLGLSHQAGWSPFVLLPVAAVAGVAGLFVVCWTGPPALLPADLSVLVGHAPEAMRRPVELVLVTLGLSVRRGMPS